MRIPAWLKEPVLRRLYRRIGVAYNGMGVSFLLGKHLSADAPITLVDAGARTGDFARALDRYCGLRRALLVEPQPAHAAALRREFTAPKFHVVQCALSDRSGAMELEINEFDATTSILPTPRDSAELAGLDVTLRERILCELQPLDALVEKHPLGPVDLLKIDVQGAEHLVLAGAAATLRAVKLVWCEVSFRPLYQGSVPFGDIHQQMRVAGFQLLELEPGYRSPEGELLQADALFSRR